MSKLSQLLLGNSIIFGVFSIIGLINEMSLGTFKMIYFLNLRIDSNNEILLYATILVAALVFIIEKFKVSSKSKV